MNKPEEISLLYDISQALHQNLDIKKSLYSVLEILAASMNMVRGTITFLNPFKNEITIEVAYGLSPHAIDRGKYQVGEGVTGKVVETGKPLIISDIRTDARFLNKTAARPHQKSEKISFVCVPIQRTQQVIGTLSADVPADMPYTLEQASRLLEVISTMVAQHVYNLEKIQWEKEKLQTENKQLKGALENKYKFANMIGNSNPMREVLQMISQVSGANATVLIRGESGTGKELIASSIHYNSPRAQKPFIKINCATLPANLIESELFGHEKGSFTGAIRQKIGKFEQANCGTLFLDEIGSINLEVQAKLLRVLQEKEFERVGGDRPIKTDVRVIAATNKNLEEAVEEDSFRPDLYYRLNVFPIYVPPLRKRKTDILLLADYFLEKYAGENNKKIDRFSTPAIDAMMGYHWPGNVRELENCIERAVILCDNGVIQTFCLPPSLQMAEGDAPIIQADLSLDQAIENLEKEMIIGALKQTKGNMKLAAEKLKTTVRKISYRAQHLRIDYKDYR